MIRAGSAIFSLVAALAWAALLYVSIHAVSTMGAAAAGTVFVGDFAHPWRAQFGTDFSIHLLLVAAWMIWRSRSWIGGIVCAVLAVNLGALFTLPFLLIAMGRSGSLEGALLGFRALPTTSDRR
jgi:hypothetical protein